jgi:hypothetical protein
MRVTLPLAILSAMYVVFSFALLMLARRAGNEKSLWFLGALLAGFILYGIFDTLRSCGFEPKSIPPNCDDPDRCGEGQVIFPCDGPLGTITHSFTRFFGPVTTLLIAVLTYVIAKKPRHKK